VSEFQKDSQDVSTGIGQIKKNLTNENFVRNLTSKLSRSILTSPGCIRVKRELKEGLEIMMSGMKSIMNGVSDGVASERMAREAEKIRTEDKMEKIMD
jgi:hypothetical protein